MWAPGKAHPGHGVRAQRAFCRLWRSLLAGYSGQAYLGMGDNYLLPSIAVVVIGGTSILGGKGSYVQTVAGAF